MVTVAIRMPHTCLFTYLLTYICCIMTKRLVVMKTVTQHLQSTLAGQRHNCIQLVCYRGMISMVGDIDDDDDNEEENDADDNISK